MGKIYMVGSQKGGVGKTTTTLNLAYFLQKMGKKVLAVDFDSQANLTACFGIENTGELENTIGHLMMAEMEDAKLPAPKRYIRTKEGIDFIPASIYLSVVDAKLRLEMGAEKMLSGILEPLREKYDYILIDTCPSLGTLTINALAAADDVIITVNPQLLAMMGMQDFLKTVMKIKRRINPKLEIAGILLTMCDTRTKLCKVLTEQVEDCFQGQVRFLYKGIIIKHNKTEPTYTKTSLFLCEKRRFFMARTEKGGNIFKLAGPRGLAFFHLIKKEVSKWPMKK
nr:AAA family ATPase [uncultured Faecalicatena sp.]